MRDNETFEFEAGFADAETEHPRGLVAAAVERVILDVGKAYARRPADWAWDSRRKVALEIAVQGEDVAGVGLDSCARVVATALRAAGMVESEAQVYRLAVTKAATPGKPHMLVAVCPL